MILLILFISSSMTYHQQTSVPWLARVLAGRPLAAQLNGIHFHYAGEVISITHLGYFKFVEFFVRKGAHVLTYFALGGSLAIGLKPYLRGRSAALVIPPIMVTGLAAYDEFHQLLTGDRSPMFQDVMLDTVAGLVAVVIVWTWRQARKH
ncbi:integral membrane protein [Lacticaseibacillus brantae DSM 23927]|uniref:Integral membrane protein n=1 Tax=Lacticaseibacillus brantae DSM 23927 TaxID=1423727 RepID=A0A0R2B1Z5_9LACO|nr:integral membrane protein [Lacticaseibacillus brantae DSM 23927]